MKKQALLRFALLITFFNLICSKKGFSQSDSSWTKKLQLGLYLDTYFAYNSQNTPDHAMPPFLYSYNRNREFNINIATIDAKYYDKNVRASLSIMTGTYAQSNLASEPAALRNLYEANIGVKISKQKDIWIDAGILPSHIGFESAKGMYNWNVTPTILADNSPYYETGVRLAYTSANKNWYMAALVLNGWQRIQRINGNNSLAYGHQLTYTNEKLTLNSSSFIGNIYPDSVKKMRYYHNLFARYQWLPKLGITAGFDIGAEQKVLNSKNYNYWWAGSVIAKYNFTNKFSTSARYEYFRDKNTTLLEVNTTGGFVVNGYSINFDYFIHKNVLWRIEAENLRARTPIFIQNSQASKNNISFTATLAVQL